MAVPFDPERGGLEKANLILEHAVQHPEWFPVPLSEEQRAESAWMVITHPLHLSWEVWRGEDLVGILLLTDIVPQVEARLHFLFFDRSLVGKTRLLTRFLRFCFEDLGFQRIGLWVPEFVKTLESFARRKLKFTYEGEAALRMHKTVLQWKERSPGDNIEVWMARRGSRRERAHWHADGWHDVICLRLTAPEFHTIHGAQP